MSSRDTLLAFHQVKPYKLLLPVGGLPDGVPDTLDGGLKVLLTTRSSFVADPAPVSRHEHGTT